MANKVAEGEAAPLPFPRQTSACVCGLAVTGVAAAAPRQNSGLQESKVHDSSAVITAGRLLQFFEHPESQRL